MVRKAVIEDIESINKLGKLIRDDFDTLFKIVDILESKYDKVFVYEEKDEVIGFLHIIELDETVDIINIVVREDRRNINIGSLLIDYMFDSISENIQLITLEVAINNVNAISLYEKFGFEIINTRSNYYQNVDAYLMGKVLK